MNKILSRHTQYDERIEIKHLISKGAATMHKNENTIYQKQRNITLQNSFT